MQSASLGLRFLFPSERPAPALEALYLSAFPHAERRALTQWRALHAAGGNFAVGELLRGDCARVGLLTRWRFAAFSYVEHFAVSPTLRGGGLGAAALALLREAEGERPIVLEVEPPTTALARRRIGFYTRCGYTLSPAPYTQPPYRRGEDALPLCLMTTSPAFLEGNAGLVVETLHREVYGVGR